MCNAYKNNNKKKQTQTLSRNQTLGVVLPLLAERIWVITPDNASAMTG